MKYVISTFFLNLNQYLIGDAYELDQLEKALIYMAVD